MFVFDFNFQHFQLGISTTLLSAPLFVSPFLFVSPMALCTCGGDNCPIHPWSSPWQCACTKAKLWGYTVRLKYHEHPSGFCSFHLDFYSGHVLRKSNKWHKHITLFWTAEVSERLRKAIKKKWRHRVVHLTISGIGNGTVWLANVDPLTQCPLLSRARSQSWYRNIGLHISF